MMMVLTAEHRSPKIFPQTQKRVIKDPAHPMEEHLHHAPHLLLSGDQSQSLPGGGGIISGPQGIWLYYNTRKQKEKIKNVFPVKLARARH